jgi:uncharacterized protein
MELNVFGNPIISCCNDPLTGYFRDGYCRTISQDSGKHLVCAVVTKEFLEFSASRGNNLITPIPQWNFPGLKPGDKWCLCISRWLEAVKEGKAPSIVLEATHQKALNYTSMEVLESFAFKS